MEHLTSHIQGIYNANRRSGRFVVDIAKVVEALNTKVFIPDHRLIVQTINTVVKEPHTCTVNSTRTHIEVSFIGK